MSGFGSTSLKAEIICVGTELLLGQIIDTHGPTLATMLAECGITCQRRTTVGDNADRIIAAITEALSRSEIVITVGGLGPTGDDITRDCIAVALGDKLVLEPAVERKLKAFFAQRGITYAESNSRQAMRPESAVLIDNPYGTAPGLRCEKKGKTVIALPGPPGEFNPMAHGSVKDYLQTRTPGTVIHSRVLRVIGIGESLVEQQLVHLMQDSNPTLAPYAHTGEVHLRLTAMASSVQEADRLIDPLEEKIRAVLGTAVYGVGGTTLEMAVMELVKERNLTVAVAESMTGGGLGERLTSNPGSSAVFAGGWIPYSVAMKVASLEIPVDVVLEHGPVSGEVARRMATQARVLSGASIGVSITGNAGPTTDLGSAPVGQTFIAVATEAEVQVSEFNWRGIRQDIRRRATQQALHLLRENLLKGA